MGEPLFVQPHWSRSPRLRTRRWRTDISRHSLPPPLHEAGVVRMIPRVSWTWCTRGEATMSRQAAIPLLRTCALAVVVPAILLASISLARVAVAKQPEPSVGAQQAGSKNSQEGRSAAAAHALPPQCAAE